RQYSLIDYASTVFAFAGVSLPSFFLGLGGIYLLGLKLDLLPTGGMRTLGAPPGLGDLVYHLILPALVLSLVNMGSLVRYTRSSMLDVVRQDFVRTARSKGLAERTVIYRHALRNALIPVITLLGLQIPDLLGGAVITEQIFQWPGMGRLTIEAITQRDYPLLMGLTMLTAVLVVVGNLIADVMYCLVDPRVRHR
ncbi:MAG TPA: ABC transporter permease, partial [Firmicutes bacterium]|nr:ABC transporter permease [Bacillota bacterium]